MVINFPLGGDTVIVRYVIITGHHVMEIRRCVGDVFFFTERTDYPQDGITICIFTDLI